MTKNTTPCNCGSCAGATCACGCQDSKAARRAVCRCGDTCGCSAS